MYTIEKAKQNIANKINKNVETHYKVSLADLVLPPNPEMGDLSFACFSLSKEMKKNPVEVASDLAKKIKPCQTVKSIEAAGPYLNFKLQPKKLAQGVLSETGKKDCGQINIGKNKKVLVEFACPNVNKPFHIGHLRNIILGESIVRLLESANYKVVRVNYPSDIGMNIAKSIWGITQMQLKLKKVADKDISKKMEFLGKAYARGSQEYEKNEKAKLEINEINKLIYKKDESVKKLYNTARGWSLKYFDIIYKRLNSHFDKTYFESEVVDSALKIVQAGLKKGVFRLSEGAVIFEGGKHGLHDRVFINSAGLPIYEAKDLALAKKHLSDYKPSKIIHVVAQEQAEYFKVVFKALENLIPNSKGIEEHLSYGMVNLKGVKMSSRLGNVITTEDLLNQTKSEIIKIVKKNKEIKDKPSHTYGGAGEEDTAEKITIAAVKYSMLKSGKEKNIIFDLKESVSLSGNSGPYLQYSYARIQSILTKVKKLKSLKVKKSNSEYFSYIKNIEHKLLLKLALFPDITKEAVEKYEPALVAKYLFELSQEFNDYYHQAPILKAKPEERAFRLELLKSVAIILDRGINLLGFETVDKM
ncbi:MAG: arginine--tRNA ligase [Patescibacteria group bacterium]|jgi:arginyl-tRNA synthetase